MSASHLHKKLRRCSNCGKEAHASYNSCKKYKDGQVIYCGYMRVVR